MTRRAAAGLGRLLPLLLIAAALVIVAGAALLPACGGSSGGGTPGAATTDTATPSGAATAPSSPSASPSAAPAVTTIRLYFLRGEKLGVAERRVAHTTMPATAAMKALLAGPTAAEKAAGLTSAVPEGTGLLGLSIVDGTRARVDLSDAFASGGGSLSMTARVAQVVYTLTRFPTVRSVEFLIGGETVEALGGEGVPLAEAQRRAGLAQLRAGHLRRVPRRRRRGLQPVHPLGHGQRLRGLVPGTSRRLVPPSHRERDRAGEPGAPGRGRFAKEIAFSTSAKRGTLIVYDQSMEDGSRQDEIRIPVSFSSD